MYSTSRAGQTQQLPRQPEQCEHAIMPKMVAYCIMAMYIRLGDFI